MTTTYSGYVTLIGRPNVGKSTLLNRFLGQKISITSKKPQTTRHQIHGIYTQDEKQIIFVDTPGLHLAQGKRNKALNHYMNSAAKQALRDVDIIVFVLDRTKWSDEDELVFQQIKHLNRPIIVAFNKIDWLEDKESLLPFLQEVNQKHDFAALVPISALNGKQVNKLLQEIEKRLPEGPHFYPEDQVTNVSSRFLASEILREKITRLLGEELPYAVNVEIEKFEYQNNVLHLHALILVEREGQKKILIGNKGAQLKELGTAARLDMEKTFDSKVMLNLWVKVKSNWSDDERALKSLGYTDIN